MKEADVALICKALSDSNRIKVINALCGGEKCACELLEEFEITQPTLSHHMKVLCGCGLVKVRRKGKWAHYSLDRETLLGFCRYMNHLACKTLEERGNGDGVGCDSKTGFGV